jgi:hypothetical protein
VPKVSSVPGEFFEVANWDSGAGWQFGAFRSWAELAGQGAPRGGFRHSSRLRDH